MPTLAQRETLRQRPDRAPVMFQSWRHLLFLHWAWDPAAIQATLPRGLHVDTHDGQAWLGVVPFWMDAVRPRFCPPLPGLSWFLELNLRTYVHDDAGRPGVWFYSLDCNQPTAVRIARSRFHLPYVHARQTATRPTDTHPPTYASLRRDRSARPDHSTFTYAPGGPVFNAAPGTLEYFLAERYLLFSHDSRHDRIHTGRVWHPPYPLQPARVDQAATTLFAANHLPTPDRPHDHALYSPGVSVSIFPLQPAGA